MSLECADTYHSVSTINLSSNILLLYNDFLGAIGLTIIIISNLELYLGEAFLPESVYI